MIRTISRSSSQANAWASNTPGNGNTLCCVFSMRIAGPYPDRVNQYIPRTVSSRELTRDAMPDWFYRTVSRPLLFRLPAETARDLALGMMGKLARLPFGPAVIDLLGHMCPDVHLRRALLGITFP